MMSSTSTEHPDLEIDPALSDLIPPLSQEELTALEASPREDGCRDPLIVWKYKNTLVDGHNRYRICREHGIHYSVVEKEFADRDAVKAFIWAHQTQRRNLTPEAI